ncbi:MAG: hypothetical protein WBF53_14580 [Litorimonas sp.]
MTLARFNRGVSLIGGIVAAGLVVAILLQMQSCSRYICPEEVIQRVSAPDNATEIVVERVNCGAMSGFVYNVHVLDSVRPHMTRSNLILRTGGLPSNITWMENGGVSVQIAPQAELFYSKTRVGDITIEYRDSD